MSVGPLGGGGIVSSAAGSPLAQTKGTDKDRQARDVGNQKRQQQSEIKAEAASGIGETDGEEHTANERDADGRRLWEQMPSGDATDGEKDQDDSGGEGPKDATGQRGNLLDLNG